MALKNNRKLKLLIIDDEQDICRFEKYIFEKNNFKVYTAQTGTEALRVAKKVQPDIALIDIHLRKSASGLEILERLLKIASNCKCIMASWDREKASEAKKKGAVGFLIKPTEVKDLVGIVKKAAKMTVKIKR